MKECWWSSRDNNNNNSNNNNSSNNTLKASEEDHLDWKCRTRNILIGSITNSWFCVNRRNTLIRVNQLEMIQVGFNWMHPIDDMTGSVATAILHRCQVRKRCHVMNDRVSSMIICCYEALEFLLRCLSWWFIRRHFHL